VRLATPVEARSLSLSREENIVQFIEQIFGIAPDGGNGMLEFLLFAIPIASLVILYAVRRKRGDRRHSK